MSFSFNPQPDQIISFRGKGLSSGANEQTAVQLPHCIHWFSDEPLIRLNSLLNLMSGFSTLISFAWVIGDG
jgi:hypothetical protein